MLFVFIFCRHQTTESPGEADGGQTEADVDQPSPTFDHSDDALESSTTDSPNVETTETLNRLTTEASNDKKKFKIATSATILSGRPKPQKTVESLLAQKKIYQRHLRELQQTHLARQMLGEMNKYLIMQDSPAADFLYNAGVIIFFLRILPPTRIIIS